MKRYILSLSVICSLLLCGLCLPSCLSDDGMSLSLEPGNPLKMLRGTWRIKDIFRGSQSGISSLITPQVKLPQVGEYLKVGDLLAFGEGIGGKLGQSGTFKLTSASGTTTNLPWAFTQTVVDGQPYTGGITLAGLRFDITCWTPERWVITPDDDSGVYIELEHDDDPVYVPEEPAVTKCDSLVKKIVITCMPLDKSPQRITYTFEYNAPYNPRYGAKDVVPRKMTVSGEKATGKISGTYTYSYEGGNVLLYENGSLVKTFYGSSESGSFGSAEFTWGKNNVGYYARLGSRSVPWNYVLWNSIPYIEVSSSSTGEGNGYGDISSIVAQLSNYSGKWNYELGHQLNNTNLDLNVFLMRLLDYDPAQLFPMAAFNFYQQKFRYIIGHEDHQYGDILWERDHYTVQTNGCNYPTSITFDEYEGYRQHSGNEMSKSADYTVEISY